MQNYFKRSDFNRQIRDWAIQMLYFNVNFIIKAHKKQIKIKNQVSSLESEN